MRERVERNLNNLSIGMFDSGVGGLTILQEVARKMPREKIIYYGDTARVPYGGKSRETIVRYAVENTLFLLEKNIKLLVVACNTAAAHSMEKLKRYFNIPIVDVIESALEEVASLEKCQNIALLATRGTIHSEVYQKKILKRIPHANLWSIQCPLFAPLIEEGFVRHSAAREIVREYLAPLKGKKIDTVLLGCTHYPLLSHLIEEELGSDVAIVDSASACAINVAKLLKEANMESESLSEIGDHIFYVSDDPVKFGMVGEAFLGKPLLNIEKLSWH